MRSVLLGEGLSFRYMSRRGSIVTSGGRVSVLPLRLIP